MLPSAQDERVFSVHNMHSVTLGDDESRLFFPHDSAGRQTDDLCDYLNIDLLQDRFQRK